MSKHKLLLADDSVTIQKVVNLTFADEGIEVTAVGDGDAAMQKFVESVPDLVMVDVNMPGIDGYRICEMIKQDAETRHIPVILLVGSFEPFDEEEARRVGADDFLTKPFQSIRQLVNKVSDLLNGKKSGTFGDEAAAVNNFEDTLEMPAPSEVITTTDNFGDAAMDDEMIQTNQIGSLPVNEAQKFESAAADFESPENVDVNSEAKPSEQEFAEDTAENDLSEDESSLNEYSEEIENDSADEDESPPRHENIYEFANEQELENEADSAKEIKTNEVEARENLTEEAEIFESETEFTPEENEKDIVAEVKHNQSGESEPAANSSKTQEFELDDFDLLELPQSRKISDEKPEISSEKTEITAGKLLPGNLSPEEIEAIADKVVEKLSDRVIKRIVREVFAQMTKKK